MNTPVSLTSWLARGLAAIAVVVALAGNLAAADLIEFLSGAKVEGSVTKIDTAAKQVAFDAKIGGRTLSRIYPYGKIHAVTYQGKRYVLNEMSAAPAPKVPRPSGGGDDPRPAKTPSRPPRSAGNIKTVIEQAGKTPPDWYDSTPLDYPASLDLTWPPKPPGGWNNQKNVGQYLWDVINPNPGRWRSGVRLIHHLLAMHKDDPEKRTRAMRTLGSMYFNLFQDYARAAFWWQQAGVGLGANDSVALAECYFRLGNKSLAEQLLVDPLRPKANNRMRVGMIKLWGDMGEPAKAVKLAEWYVKAGGQPHMAYLFAGDACRSAGRYQDAMKLYQMTISAPPPAKGNVDRTVKRAQASLDAVKLFELSDVSRVKDGKHRSSSVGYEGPVEVEVEVLSGRIEDVRIVKHNEKQFYSALTDVPQQIIEKQSVKGVDATSRATITGEAVINATAKALASGAN